VPLAIDEGMAIHAETTARYLMFHRALLESGGAKLTVAQLLAVENLPPLNQRPAFYAECYNLVAWLLTQRDPGPVAPPPSPPGRGAGGEGASPSPSQGEGRGEGLPPAPGLVASANQGAAVPPAARVVELCRLTHQIPPAVALLQVYKFPDLATAEKAYRTFLEDQGLIRPAPAAP